MHNRGKFLFFFDYESIFTNEEGEENTQQPVKQWARHIQPNQEEVRASTPDSKQETSLGQILGLQFPNKNRSSNQKQMRPTPDPNKALAEVQRTSSFSRHEK